MSILGFVILVVLVLLGIWIFVELAKLPGSKAQQSNHPQAEAIKVLGWLGLLFGGVPWLIALVWAHTNPGATLAPEPKSPDPGAAHGQADE